MTSLNDASYSSARLYFELFDGVPDVDRITNCSLRLQVGGTEAPLAGDRFRVSLYGRQHINGANLVTLHREFIDLPDIGSVGLDEAWRYWRTVEIRCDHVDEHDVKCLVLKVEAMLDDPTYTPQNEDYVPSYDDQSTTSDPPPWGVRLLRATVFATDLHRNVTIPRVLQDIVSPYYAGAACPSSTVVLDQCSFVELPRDRWDAMDEVCDMTGWDYQVWDNNTLGFYDPDAGTGISIPRNHAGVEWSNGPDESDSYNAVRVQYTNKYGRPREIVMHGGTYLGGQVVADTIVAPDSIRSKAGAERCARRWLRAHGRIPNVGDITVTGEGPWGDALLIRPGRRVGKEKISHVTLNPLEWSATLQFGVNVDTYDAWVARLAAGAHPKKR